MRGTTEFEVRCTNGHRFYERISLISDDWEWTPCPKCGAERITWEVLLKMAMREEHR